MTLVVARIDKGKIAIAADTLLTEHDKRLPHQSGTLKSCMLPGGICVSFCNSPILAQGAFQEFAQRFPRGSGFGDAVAFFEASSKATGNDYILAFPKGPHPLVKISDGKRDKPILRSTWIGDHNAYKLFREYETRLKGRPEDGRAVNVAIFADEEKGSPASDLYSAMRNLMTDRKATSVGGFVSVISSRGNEGFRFSSFSDVLYDWPDQKPATESIDLNESIDLMASGENSEFAIAQITPAYLGMNLVAFYFVKSQKLFVFHGENNGLATQCHVESNIEAEHISDRLNELFGCDLCWLAMVMSSGKYNIPVDRASMEAKGISLGMFCHANTFKRQEGAPNYQIIRLPLKLRA